MTGNAAALRAHLFGAHPAAEALLAEQETDGATEAVGFALYFANYSTFRTARASIWRISSWSTPTAGGASGARCSPR